MQKTRQKRKSTAGQEQDIMNCDIIDLPIEDARRVKWLRGKAEHGPVMVSDPLQELFAEAVDGTNYTTALLAEPQWSLADRRKLMRAESAFVRVARVAQALRANYPKRRWSPRVVEFS